ncbi:amidohydrolase family protein [Pigmentiphaga soli]|uniref:Amidohydrolase family protein n=1 Tax=Pigmentiphaga soli TaxID=1007095 RepID=A0ABP8H1N0_9BURK
MSTAKARYLPFDPNPRAPSEAPPRNSCDCQFHISGHGYKKREGATYSSEGATFEAARRMHEKLGIDRGVIVQSTVYATDHTIVLDALRQLGPNYRAIGVIDDTLSDGDLDRLKAAGVCGIRFTFREQLNLVPSWDLFERSAARCKEIGWILKINAPWDGFNPELVARIRKLKDQTVEIDHMGRVRGLQDPNLPIVCDLLKEGNVWLMISNGHRYSTYPHFNEAVDVAKAFIEANPDRLVWGTDWPHPLHADFMPNDADLLELLYRYSDDPAIRKKILVDNPARLFGFPA